VVVVLSKIDVLEDEQQLQEIIQWVKSQSKALLDIDPLIFPVSAKKALKAKLAVNSAPDEAARNVALQSVS